MQSHMRRNAPDWRGATRSLPVLSVVIALAIAIGAVAISAKTVSASTPAQVASGDAVYFESTSRGSSDIWYIVPGEKARRAPFSSRGSDDKEPAVSSDGRWLAFSSERGGDFEIYVVDLTAGPSAKPRRVTTNTSADTNPAWSPDAKRITYVTDRYNVAEIMTIPATGCKRRARRCDTRITRNRYQDLDPAWSPDGSTIAFASKRPKDRGFQIYTMATNGRSTSRITSATGHSTGPAWSPSGAAIAFESKRKASKDRTSAIYTMSSSGQGQKKITPGTQNEQSPTWSPGGQTLTFASVGRRSSTVSSVSASGGRVDRLLRSRSVVGSVAWGDAVQAGSGSPIVSAPPATPTPVPTATPVPPTPVPPTPIPTQVPPTSTPVPSTATSTPIPTNTSTPAPTSTPSSGGGGLSGSTDELVISKAYEVEVEGQFLPLFEFSGGELVVEQSNATSGGSQQQQTTLGSSYVSDLRLDMLVVPGGASGAGSSAQIGPKPAISKYFSIEVEGIGVLEQPLKFATEPTVIEAHETTTGDQQSQHKSFEPGEVLTGQISLTISSNPADVNELMEWAQHALATGEAEGDRRNLISTSLDRDGQTIVGVWNYFGVLPIEVIPHEGEFGNQGPTLEFVFEYDRVEFGAAGATHVLHDRFFTQVYQGSPERTDVAITEVAKDQSVIRVTNYLDGFITQYDFPVFDVASDELLIESFTIKPERLEVS